MKLLKGNLRFSKLNEKRVWFNLTIIIVILFFSFGFNSQSTSNKTGRQTRSQLIIQNGDLYYLANTIVVKFKLQQTGGLLKAQNLTSLLNQNFGQFRFSSTKELFGTNSTGTAFGLNRIMVVNYSSDDDPLYVASKIKKLNSVEWAEPKFVRRVAFDPNDPGYLNQYNLAIVKAAQAWDISQGDTNVVIGIVDTGVDWPHPDLYANIWHNPHWRTDINFPNDSIGWDFGGLNGTPDNNPSEDKPVHGTFVAGVASAVTNNSVGVAGIGFKCKIMAVKVARADQTDAFGSPFIVYGDEGIKYAADNGAKVINCSWGGGGFSNAEQDIINYAISKGALVVAAAGNDGSSGVNYPAAYKGVLSVGATDSNDKLAWFSNYGTNLDVCAPGVGIFSTWDTASYLSGGSGTSFSSPLTAGLAALVYSHFPNYTPLQVGEQIRVNCDNIDSLNPGLNYQLGQGRINAYKTLANSNSESVRATDFQFSDAAPGGNGDGVFEPGETISIGVKFMNYLRPISNLSVSLVSMNPYASVSNSSFNISNVATLDSLNNYNSKFSFTLSNSVPYDENLQFRLDYTDGNYSDFQLFDVAVNPSYLTQSGNNVALTITSKGSFAFNDYFTNLQGDGFKYMNGNNMLFEGSLIIGNSQSTIEDAARGTNQSYQDTSFKILQPFKLKTVSSSGDQQGLTIFSDDNAGTGKLGLTIKLQSYTYSSAADQNYIILRYSMTNNSSSTISNFYSGIFCDWDLVDGQNDSTSYDAADNFGYAVHVVPGFNTVAATALISSTNYGYWGILNSDTGTVAWGIYNGFPPSQKWQAISSGIGRPKAGAGDISEVTSGGPFTITAGQTLDVAFAIAAANNMNDLRTAIRNARSKYQNIVTGINQDNNQIPLAYGLMQNFPNPFNPSTVIKYQIAKEGHVTLKIFDALGREVETLVDMEQPAGNYSFNFNFQRLASGIYFYRLKSGNFSDSKKMILLK